MAYFNKELDEIGFKLYEPCEKLKPYILNYWKIEANLTEKRSLKILTDGSLGFVINFANPFFLEVSQKQMLCSSTVTLMGQTKYPTIMNFNDRIEAIGIRFNPAGAYRFFDEELSSFQDRNIDYKDSFWNFMELFEKLKITSKEQRLKLCDEFLLQRLALSKKENSKYTFEIIDLINKRKGDISVEELSSCFDISVRQIERIFKKELGLTVKLFIRIIRLRNTRDKISSLKVDTLTNTAYDNGFFDQAHFIKEFKSFMSETPKNYYSNKLQMAKELNYKKYKA